MKARFYYFKFLHIYYYYIIYLFKKGLFTSILQNPIFLIIYIYIIYLDTQAVFKNNMKGGSEMFDNSRYLTCGVDSTIQLELHLFLWECVEHMPAPKDYLQVFELSPSGSMQSIVHSS